MDVIQEVEIGCCLKTPHLDKLTPSETTFDLDEVDETIGVAGDVPRWPCLAFRVFGAPLVRLRREDVQAVVAPKVLTRSGTRKLASSRGTMARNYGRRRSCAVGEHVCTARHGFRMGACAVFSTRGVNCTCACM